MIRIVIVRPKIWNVIVIGILPPPLRGEPKPPIACWSPWGHKTIFILPKTAHFVNSRRRTSPPRSARHLPFTRGGFSTPVPKAPLVKGRLFRPYPRLPLSRGAGAQRLRGYPAAAGKGSPLRGAVCAADGEVAANLSQPLRHAPPATSPARGGFFHSCKPLPRVIP